MFVSSVLRPRVELVRTTNVAQAVQRAAAFVAAATNPLAVLIDVALSAGGGGNVDLEIMWGDVLDSEADLPYPLLSLAEFEAFESTDGPSLKTLINDAVIARPLDIAYAWGAATGATAGKLCALVAFITPGS